MKKVKLGLIGYGNIGTAHVANIDAGRVPNMEIAALCDISEERRKAFSANHPDVPVFEDAEELMKSGLCDTVLVAIPHYYHPPLVMKAFEYGLNAISEKPAGVYTKQVKEMNAAAAKTDKLFGIMFNQRTNPMYQKLRDMVQSGELGHIKRITWIITHWYRNQAYHDSSAWRSTWDGEGGGALINQNPHQLDLWQWMFGMPDRVYAKAYFGKYMDIEVDDDVTAIFEYDNGTTGEYITSTGEAPGTNRLEVACDMGKIVIEDGKMTFFRNVISEREHNKICHIPFESPECWECNIPVDTSGGRQHSGILENFASAVLEGKELLAKGEEGIKALTLSNAIYLSTWTGETVDINNFPDDKFYELLQEKVKNARGKKESKSVVADLNGTY